MKTFFFECLSVVVKIIGFFYVPTGIPAKHRAEARSIVYNYVLQHRAKFSEKKRFGRLFQRKPLKAESFVGWWLFGNYVHPCMSPGRVKYRDVSALQFWWWLIAVWMFLDDDSWNDYTDINDCRQIVNGEQDIHVWRFTIPHPWKMFSKSLRKVIATGDKRSGNAMDIGDLRAIDTLPWSRAAQFTWNTRNLGKNFQYMFTGY